MPGYGGLELVPAGWYDPDAPSVEVWSGGRVVPHLGSRAYFADVCTPGRYSNTQYVGLNLLGKTMRYTTNITGAKCGCNAAVYLTSMRQNDRPTVCADHYCDSQAVCGESCVEIDIQEANQYAWHSTLHTADDRSGIGGGYGGGESWNGPRDWTSQDYGPGGRCVDTSFPFEVAVSFPVDDQGSLAAMEVTLSQKGRPCPLMVRLGSYSGMGQISRALEAGVTPVVTYWNSHNLLWMDGKGADGQGPCAAEDEADKASCSGSVQFSGFSVVDIGSPQSLPEAAPGDTRQRRPRATHGAPPSSIWEPYHDDLMMKPSSHRQPIASARAVFSPSRELAVSALAAGSGLGALAVVALLGCRRATATEKTGGYGQLSTDVEGDMSEDCGPLP
jgi:hypothetical protein